MLSPLQAACWLMSIFWGLGAVPSNLTVPLTLAAVLGSMGVAACWVAAFSSGAFDDCSVFSFLLQPTNSHKPRRQSNPSVTIVAFLLFMISPFHVRFSEPAICKQ